MAIMYFESAGTMSPSVQNKSTNATGLIQFMPSTAKGLGTSVEALKKMSAVQQLDYVLKYYKPFKGKIKSYVDTYFVTFFPAAVGMPDNYSLQTSKLSAALIARVNPSFDPNKDGKIQVWEVKKVMLSKLPKEWLRFENLPTLVVAYKKQILTGVTALGLGTYLVYKYGRKN